MAFVKKGAVACGKIAAFSSPVSVANEICLVPRLVSKSRRDETDFLSRPESDTRRILKNVSSELFNLCEGITQSG